jgi:hypothetical protein
VDGDAVSQHGLVRQGRQRGNCRWRIAPSIP